MRIARILAAALALTLGSVVLAACSSRGGPKPPRLVVLYAPCTLRAASLSPYDASIPFTPALAEFARDSVVFRRHTTEAEQSGTAYASIFSGAQAPVHGVYHHPSFLRKDLGLLAETFAAAGYETWFWNGHPMAGSRLGYGRGVEPGHTVVRGPSADAPITARDATSWSGNGPEMDALLDRLAADPGLHVFVQIQFTLTHSPYRRACTPELVAAFLRDFPDRAGGLDVDEILKLSAVFEAHRLGLQWDPARTMDELGLDADARSRLARALQILYETDVRETDRLFGAFLEKLRSRGLLADSVVAFTADHGEVLDRPNAIFRWTHGFQLAPESLGVPWILRAPGRLSPRTYEKVTRSVDVFPTLAGLCGIPLAKNARVEGADLAPVLRGEREAPDLLALSHSTVPSRVQFGELQAFAAFRALFPTPDPELVGVRVRAGDRVQKLRIAADGHAVRESFDLAADPSEERNVFDPGDASDAALARKLEDYRNRLVRGFRDAEATEQLSRDEQEARLRSLGYVK